MDNQKQQKNKMAIIDSIMNHPKLSRTIHEAASAPVGSTKRDKAKSIISILNKTNPYGNFSGQGGDGQGGTFDAVTTFSNLNNGGSGLSGSYSSSGNPSSGSLGLGSFDSGLLNPSSHSITVFPSAPSLKLGASDITDLSNILSSHYSSGSGIIGSGTNSLGLGSSSFAFNKNKNVSSSPISNVGTNWNLPVQGTVDTGLTSGSNSLMASNYPTLSTSITPKLPLAGTPPNAPKVSPTPGIPPVAPKTDATPSDPFGYKEEPLKPTFKGHGIINNYDITSYATDPNHENAVLGIYNSMDGIDITDANTAQNVITQLSSKSPVTGQMVMDAATKYGVDPKLIISLMQQDSTLGTKGLAVSSNNPGNVGNDGAKKRTYNSLQGGVDAVAQWLSKHVATKDEAADTTTSSTDTTSSDSNQGAGRDWASIQSMIPNAIASNYGPELFTKMIQGSSLTGQEADLKNSLYQQYDLSNLLAEKTKVEDEAPNFKQDATDYIKGRDTYLANIDKMLSNVDTQIATTDVSGSYDSIQNYRNFLLNLKGQQNQMYGEYLQRGLDRFNTDLDKVQNNYKDAVTAYNDAFKTGDESLKSNWKDTHDILVNMYNTLDKASSSIDGRDKAVNDANKIGLDSVSTLAGYDKDWGPQQHNYSDEVIDKTTSEMVPGVSLPGLLHKWSVDQTNNPKGVLDLFQKGAVTTLKKLDASSDPTLFKKALEFSQQLDDAMNTGTTSTPGTSPLSPEVAQAIAPMVNDIKQSILNTVKGTVDTTTTPGAPSYTGLIGYLMNHAKDVSDITKELSGVSTVWIGNNNKVAPTREQLIKKHGNMDSDIVGAIWDFDRMAKNQFGEGTTIIDTIKNAAQTNSTTGDTTFSKLAPAAQNAVLLANQIIATPLFNNLLN